MAFTSYNPNTHTDLELLDAMFADDSKLVVTSIDLKYGVLSGQTSISFYDGSLDLDVDEGVLLTTGDGTPPTSNTSGSHGGGFSDSSGDSDLDLVAQQAFEGSGETFDATVVTIKFIPQAGAKGILFNLAFGSDEYPEFSDSSFVDVAGVFINGENVALFNNDPTQPLSVIDKNLELGNFRDNQTNDFPIEYDGISTQQTIATAIVPGQENTLKIAIADTGDTAYDSGMFIANLKEIPVGGGGLLLTNIGTDASETIEGNDNNEYIAGGEGHDILSPGAGEDFIDAGDGNDTALLGSGSNQVDGGKGEDKVIYSGTQDNWTISIDSGAVIVTNNLTGDIDTIVNVETIEFDDLTINTQVLFTGEDSSLASIFIGQDNFFEVTDNAVLYGAKGTETVLLTEGAIARMDANIERVEFPNALESYTFSVNGTQSTIWENNLPVAIFRGLNAPATLAFADGSGELSLTGLDTGVFAGVGITSSPAAVAAELDTNDISSTSENGSADDGNENALSNVTRLKAGSRMDISNDTTVIGDTGSEAIQLRGSPTVNIESIIERIELPNALADYEFTQKGATGVTISQNGEDVAIFDSLALTTSVAFSDGSTELSTRGLNDVRLGGVTIPSTPSSLDVELNTLDKSNSSSEVENSSLMEIIVSEEGTADASANDVLFNFDPGNFNYSIEGFGPGDFLDFVNSAEVSYKNTNKTDGLVELTATSDVTGTTTVVTLTGVPNEVDSSVFIMSQFLDYFGSATLL
ncbi:MAG: choice-of-anchor L domain-containing protein [Pseudomonadales bacterium]|nr:choice-of-anchor L domain-containing protein [Pseudomonadales bacterium]